MRVGRSLLERHHLAGAANDPLLIVTVCRNCHARLSEANRNSGIELRRDPERVSLERLVAVLLGLADFFELLMVSLRWWAEELGEAIARLDRDHPSWRDLA
jgi:hypothetical protein